LQGLDHKQGRIYSIGSISPETFFVENMVDVIIRFFREQRGGYVKNAARYGTRIVSAISNMEKKQFEQIKALGRLTSVLYSPNITLGVNFLIEASKVLQKIVPQADIEIIEEHFKGKPDVIGHGAAHCRRFGLDSEKHVNSIRVGGIVGRHEVIFGCPIRRSASFMNRSAEPLSDRERFSR
jgi:4-hydroxy-tetrahydrodipicolinate reductase